eukprot:CAMPEP_0184867508 /NCGR_PEP_ID=MMETSP0580-20130426/26883_1 /TAXON_ID=1118495 /ORGANISM="Dactyliosolen fragilissimus" /LENGTH=790 /DNA_ID=CAMNT_0027367841 /DNA_START=107 /DNA_END=2482 /DNA_ORIENTATION=-
MTYPTSNPQNKHGLFNGTGFDIVDEQDHGKIVLKSKDSLHQFLKDQLKSTKNTMTNQSKPKLVAVVYTYDDAPKTPKELSGTLRIVGYVKTDCIKNLLDPYDRIKTFRMCTLAVKRADGAYGERMKSGGKKGVSDYNNSESFKAFFEKMINQNLAAITGCDSVGRVGILVPMGKKNGENKDGINYAVWCYVAKLEDVLLSSVLVENENGTSENTSESQISEKGVVDDSDVKLWTPFESNNGNTNEDDGTGLWTPGASMNDEQNGLWQPFQGTNGSNEGTNNKSVGDTGSAFTFDHAWDAQPHKNTSNVGRKRPRPDETNSTQEETFHTNAGAAAADAFYSNLTRSLDTRADSILFHMRNFNGWIKATQIGELDPRRVIPGMKGKSTQVRRGKPLRILDLACGKGGDLGKWILHKRGIGNYVGIDVARGSLKDAALKARKMSKSLRGKCIFTCADLGSDVPGARKNKKMQNLLSWSLAKELSNVNKENDEPVFEMVPGGGIGQDDKFDVVSIQFAIHYMMQTQERARRFFDTVSNLLDIGGNLVATTIDARVVLEHMMNLGEDLHFHENGKCTHVENDDQNNISRNKKITVEVGKGACRLTFDPEIVNGLFHRDKMEDLFGIEYTFTLVEGEDHSAGFGKAVDLPEWLTPLPVLESLAKEAGLELDYAQNFHEYYSNRSDPSLHPNAHNSLYNMNVLNRSGSISNQEWEISRMYMAVKFSKIRESQIVLDDIGKDEGKDNNRAIDMTDPNVQKMYQIAMVKAKKLAGVELWSSLDGDKKNALTLKEFTKMT